MVLSNSKLSVTVSDQMCVLQIAEIPQGLVEQLMWVNMDTLMLMIPLLDKLASIAVQCHGIIQRAMCYTSMVLLKSAFPCV